MELKEVTIEDLKYGNEVLIIKGNNFYISYFNSKDDKYFVCQSATFIEKDIYYNEIDKIYLLK
jgi:hypothetical protein